MKLINWEALDILSKWTDNSIELILIDPPYNTIASKWDKYVDFNKFFDIACNKTIKAWKGRFWTIAWERPSHKAEFKREFTNYPNDVISDIPEPSAWKKLHTSEKPVKLLEKLILTHSNNWLVMDCFMWSWSCWVACKNLNRDFIGIELDENYFEIAKERIT